MIQMNSDDPLWPLLAFGKTLMNVPFRQLTKTNHLGWLQQHFFTQQTLVGPAGALVVMICHYATFWWWWWLRCWWWWSRRQWREGELITGSTRYFLVDNQSFFRFILYFFNLFSIFLQFVFNISSTSFQYFFN